ncbi:MAG: TetR family transcriptional regulator C-terminal domain-containing protein, partial [Pseudomonadota bacterium]
GTIEARVVKAPSAEAALRLAVSDLVNCWRGRSGVLFALLTALAGHNPVFRGPYRQIYRQFYAALEGVLKRLSPHLSAAEIRLRARLITALIDGSSMQIQVGDRAAYLQRVQDEAVRIAIHAA